MKIADFEMFLVAAPADEGRTGPRGVIVRLETDAGVPGWGEAGCGPELGPSQLAARRDQLLPVLAGRSPFDIEEMLRLEPLDAGPVTAAIEIASWDLVGKAAGLPLCDLLGGAYRGRIPLSVHLSPHAPLSELAALSAELAEHGYRGQTMPTAGDELDPSGELDLARLRAVREAAGEGVEITFAAKGRFVAGEARRFFGELGPLGLRAVLDPVDGTDPGALAGLARETGLPLGVTLGPAAAADVLRLAGGGGVAEVVCDPGQSGGLAATRRAAAVADAAGVAMSLAAPASLGIALAAVLHLTAATPSLDRPPYGRPPYLADAVLSAPLERHEGLLSVPAGPGLGVEVERGRLEEFQVA